MGKILFIRGGAVGDFIVTMPAIELVRESFPDQQIEILGYPSITELALAAGIADRTKSIESASLAPFFAPGADLDPELCRYFSSFDVVISYLYDPDGYFQGNLERAGVDTLLIGPFRMDETAPVKSAPEQLAAPLTQLALFAEKFYVEVSYGDTEKINPGERPLIAIHPGSGSASKNWSFESWAGLLSELKKTFTKAAFLVISGEAETETVADFLDLMDQRELLYHHANQLGLCQVARRLQSCDLFLGHDSGITHLAASIGIPGLALFGPSNPGVWAPQHPCFDYIQAEGGQLGNLSINQVLEEPKLQAKLEKFS